MPQSPNLGMSSPEEEREEFHRLYHEVSQRQGKEVGNFLRGLPAATTDWFLEQLDRTGLVAGKLDKTREKVQSGLSSIGLPNSPQSQAVASGTLGFVPGLGDIEDASSALELAGSVPEKVSEGRYWDAAKAGAGALGLAALTALPGRIPRQNGKTIMFHGTNKRVGTFKVGRTADDHVAGISLTDNPSEAGAYAVGEGGNVMRVEVDVKKPMGYPELEDWALQKAKSKGVKISNLDEFAAFDIEPDTLLKWLKEDGYDAIDYRGVPMLGYGLRVFSPTQIKPAL